jgi:cohesin loading factor subunit SCC2
MAADSHLFSNTVNKILQRVALQEGREGGTAAHSTIHHGPLTQMELSDLSLLCTRATHETGPSFESVEKEEIAALIEYLEKHVNLACGVHIIEDVCAFLQNQGSLKDFFKHDSAMTSLRMGLEAAGIITFITSTKGIDRRATNQDAMEACMTLMRGHLFKSIIPALCNKGHLVGGVQQQNTLDIKASPTKKRRTSVEPNAVSADSGSSLVDAKHLKTVYKRISDTLTLQLTLMERLATLVNEVTLDGQQILLLTNSAFAVLEIDSASREAVQLQLVSNDLVTTVFRKYPMHRETILEDLFPLLMRLPATKKQLRTYTIESSFVNYQAQCLRNILPTPGKQIQMFTFVLVSLIQSCVTRPTFDPVENGPYQLLSGLRPCRTVCEFWVAQLLQRCTRSGGDLRNVLVHLVEDLLCMFTTVPGAELLLQTFQTRLTYDLNQASPSFKTKTSAKQGNYEQTYLNTCFEIVGTVCAVQARLLATQRGAKAQGATTSSSLDGQDDDEICVQCYCGQTDDSRSLVACDHCKTFYHVNCVGFSPDAEEWFCDACHLGHLVERERVKYHGEQTCIDEVYALYHTHYSNLSNLDNGLQDATRMHLCRWVDHLEKQAEGTEKVKPRHILTGLLQLWERPAPAGKPSTNESMNRLIHALLAKTSSLCLSFKSNVAFVLKLMGDESSQVLRKLSLKALEKVFYCLH